MRIEVVKAISFGPLAGDTLELAPGMNVVYGPNESGKSSWHAAIYAAMCGMKRTRGQPTREDRAFASRHRPWRGSTWRVSASIVLDDGRTIDIEQGLGSGGRSSATDRHSKRPLPEDVVRAGAVDVATLLGLSRETAVATLFVRQADVLRVLTEAGGLQEYLERAAATSRVDTTADEAIARITDYKRNQVGLVRSGSRGPLAVATRQLKEARSGPLTARGPGAMSPASTSRRPVPPGRWPRWRPTGAASVSTATSRPWPAQSPIADAVFAMVANRLCAPRSKRALPEWVASDVVMPAGFRSPAAHHYYRALDVVAEAKEAPETHLYAALTNLTNLDLRLVCYDLTSTYFEGSTKPSVRFESRAFGYSRDHRGDRPQVVIGLLVTGDGIPIAHHVFAGNTADVSTLPGVLDDLQTRFGIGPITMVADRGLISADNVKALQHKGFSHILATRLHRDPDVAAVLGASTSPEAVWVPCPSAGSAVCEVTHDGRRFIVALSAERLWRDTARTAELVGRTSTQLRALEARVGAGRLKDKAKIAAAASRILAGSGVARLFDVEIGEGRFLYHYDEAALDYEEKLLAGSCLLDGERGGDDPPARPRWSSPTGACSRSSPSFRVLKDLIELRPVFHWTEDRVRAHIGVCVLAAVIEALMEADLRSAGVVDPDIDGQVISPRRALRELGRIRRVTLTVAERTIERDTRHSALQDRILAAFGVEAASWAPASAS